MTPDELLTTTRSVRRRLDLTRDVPLDLVKECLEIALQAPSGSNKQGWHWIVVTDSDKRAGIGEYYRRSAGAYLAAEEAAAGNAAAKEAGNAGNAAEKAAAGQARRVRDSAAYLGQHMGEVPVLVIGCLWAGTTPWTPEASQAGLWGSLLPAAWSYMLAARSRGLGTAWTTLHLRYEREIAELLGLPSQVRQGVLIPTAYYTGDTFRPAARKPLGDVLHLDRW